MFTVTVKFRSGKTFEIGSFRAKHHATAHAVTLQRAGVGISHVVTVRTVSK